jgi:hypothetical protein
MGRLAIRQVIYNGKRYFFESPYLKDGVVILEGTNGHGKSTFMDLIYYALGGKVISFDKNSDSPSKHNEIYYDEDNYVELKIEIDESVYELTRYIGDNQIFIVDREQQVLETFIYRNSNSDALIFSDWILSKLNIDVFDIVQGTRNFKLNFSDLLRLIYHDQATEVSKIYKEADNSNFISDSLEIRKAIFEVLIGKSYNEYYSLLGKYKLAHKEYEKSQAIMDSYDEFIGQILSDDLSNLIHIKTMITENQDMIEKIRNERNLAYAQRDVTSKTFEILDEQKKNLIQLEQERDDLIQIKHAVMQSVAKIIYLSDDAKRELKEIEKIRLVNKKLKLFTPNTCPYCLREVERENGKCICGSGIDEEQYEKFFYTDDEYLTILKVKQKSIQSLSALLINKQTRSKDIENRINKLNNEIEKTKKYIIELNQDMKYNQNSGYIRKLDDRENQLKASIIELNHAEELATKKAELVQTVTQLRIKVESLRNKVEKCLIEAKNDILEKKNQFSELYLELMKSADEKCYDAYIGDDYMPIINFSQYRERSAAVPKRLMYFLTLLIESIEHDISFPRFLMIDTPNKEGIDRDNLINNLVLLDKAKEYYEKYSKDYQIILTTGMGTYPEAYKSNVILTLVGEKHLLKEK